MEIISIILSSFAILISFASFVFSVKTRKESRESKRLEILSGLRKELVKNKIGLLSLFDFDYDQQLFTIIDYDFIDKKSELQIPVSIELGSSWWDEYSNEIKEWDIRQFNRYLNIYEKIHLIKNKKDQKIKSQIIIDLLERIDDYIAIESKLSRSAEKYLK